MRLLFEGPSIYNVPGVMMRAQFIFHCWSAVEDGDPDAELLSYSQRCDPRTIEATSFFYLSTPFKLQYLPLSPLASHIIGEGTPSQSGDRPIRVFTFNLRYLSLSPPFPQVSPVSDDLDLNLSSLNTGAVLNRIINENFVLMVRNTSAVPSEPDASAQNHKARQIS
jgi:hypothetical protein